VATATGAGVATFVRGEGACSYEERSAQHPRRKGRKKKIRSEQKGSSGKEGGKEKSVGQSQKGDHTDHTGSLEGINLQFSGKTPNLKNATHIRGTR